MSPRFLGHSAVYLLARIVPGVVSLLAIAVYTHLLEPTEYGYYALVLAGMDFGQRLFFIWLQMGLVRFLPAYRSRRDVFLSTVAAGFAMALGLSVIAGALFLIFRPENLPLALLMSGLLLLAANTWFELNLELVRADLQPRRYGLLEMLRSSLALLLGGLLAWAGYGAFGVLLGMSAGRMLTALLLMWRSWAAVRPRLVDFAILRRLLAYGLPLVVTYPVAWLVDFSDRFFLGKFIGADASGLYAPSYDLTRYSILFLASIIHLAAFPVNVHALEESGVRAGVRSMRQNLLGLLLVALPASVGLIMLAPNIARSLLGEEFQAAALRLIPLLAVGMFFFALRNYYVNYAFQLTGRTLFQMWITICTAVLNIALNIVLIRRVGLMGAAYASVSSYVFAFALSLYFARRIFPLPFAGRDLLKAGAVGGAMALVLWPLAGMNGRLALGLQVGAGLGVVLGMVLAMNLLGLRQSLLEKLSAWRGQDPRA